MRTQTDSREEEKYKPLDGLVIGCCLHLEARTACLLKVMHRLGATVVTAGATPFNTGCDMRRSCRGHTRIQQEG